MGSREQYKELSENIQIMHKSLNNLNASMKNMKDDMNKRFDKNDENIESKINQLTNYIDEKVTKERKGILHEVQQRIENEKHIIIYGVKDNDGKEDLRKAVEHVLQKIGLTEEIEDVRFTHRLGKFQRSKDRPVKVGFTYAYSAQKALRNARKLGKEDKIWIKEDLTQEQMTEYKKLLEEAKLKNENGTDAKNGEKWIVMNRKRPMIKKISLKRN